MWTKTMFTQPYMTLNKIGKTKTLRWSDWDETFPGGLKVFARARHLYAHTFLKRAPADLTQGPNSIDIFDFGSSGIDVLFKWWCNILRIDLLHLYFT